MREREREDLQICWGLIDCCRMVCLVDRCVGGWLCHGNKWQGGGDVCKGPEYVYLSAVAAAGIFARGLVFFAFLQNGAQISLPVRHTRKKDSLVTFTTIANNLVMKWTCKGWHSKLLILRFDDDDDAANKTGKQIYIELKLYHHQLQKLGCEALYLS